MALESATYINQLNPLNPVGGTDFISDGDDHLRMIKQSLQNTFPNITAPITASADNLTNSTYLVDSSGSANAITVAFSPAYTSYVSGMGVLVKAANTNTGAATIAVNGLSPVSITGLSGEALQGGEIIANGIYHLIYNGTSFLLTNKTGYTKTPSLIISPYTGYNATVKNSSSGTLTLGTNTQSNIVLNSDGSVNVAGNLIVGGTANITGTLTGNTTTQATTDSSTKLASTAFVKAALGNYAGFLSLSANTTLTNADAGKLIELQDATMTINMPAISTVTAGMCFYFTSRITAPATVCTIKKSTTDGGATIYNVKAEETFAVVFDGSDWSVAGGISEIYNNSYIFNGSYLANSKGCLTLPTGLKIQWVRNITTSAGGGSDHCVFKESFSSSTSYVAMANNDGATGNAQVAAKAASTCTVYTLNASDSPTTGTASVIAIGY